MRRFWCVLLAAVCGLSLALAPSVAQAEEDSTDDLIRFSDVSEGIQFYDEIMWLANSGVSTGWPVDDGREFRPVVPVARDAMAAFLYRLAGSPGFEAPDVSPFSDVPADSQFYTEISWLADAGISTGWVMEDGTRQFRGLDSVARDAMAAFLYRYADVVLGEDVAGFQAPGVSPFVDVPVSSQFFRQISWLAGRGVSTGWVNGDGTAEFRDLEPVNRDAMAAFMYRLTGEVVHPSEPDEVSVSLTVPLGSSVTLSADGISGFADVTVVSGERAGVTWGSGGRVDVSMSAEPGVGEVVLDGLACDGEDCLRPVRVSVELEVSADLAAAADGPVDVVIAPSSDRVEAATAVSPGVAALGDEVVVVLDEDAGRQVADAVAAGVGGVVSGGMEEIGIYVVRWSTPQDIEARIAELGQDGRVVSAEAGLLVETETENVPGYSDESAYGSDDRWHLDMIGAPSAWQNVDAAGNRLTGSGVSIGIFELAAIPAQEDLPVPELILDGSSTKKTGREFVNHISHVSGLACAKDNGKGTIGVAPECTLYGATAAWDYGAYSYLPADLKMLSLLFGFGVRVVNMSIGQIGDCRPVAGNYDGKDYPACDASDISEYMDYAYKAGYAMFSENETVVSAFDRVMRTSGKDSVLVLSAGNSALPTVTNPWSQLAGLGKTPNVLTVASVDANRNLSFFSNYGFWANIAAPGGYSPDGEEILSTGASGTEYARMSGTSMAAPLVTGSAALVFQQHPDWTGAQVTQRLISTAQGNVTSRNEKDGLQVAYGRSAPLPILNVGAAVAEGNPSGPVTTVLVSRALDGAQANSDSWAPSISADGRWVAYESYASNLVAGDTNGTGDVFVWDRVSGATERVSVASDGTQANGESYSPAMSADGRWVTYTSQASNLVAGDTNERPDVFVWDRVSGATERVSVASDGTQANGESYSPSISADGRWVAYESYASNLVAGDTNGTGDVFVWDRVSGVTQRVSVASDGTQANSFSRNPAISADGRWVTYDSSASNLVAGDTENSLDVFVWDRVSGVTERVSVASDGTQASSGPSYNPAISADGRWVTYASDASNLVAGDTNSSRDVFVWDRVSRVTERVSVASDGTQANGHSWVPSMSADGRWVTYDSSASNLVAGDTNGSTDVFLSTNPLTG